MAEWTKAPVLKTGDGQPSVGSNPTPSASTSSPYYVYVLYTPRFDRLYIGSSAEPDERLTSHNAGRGGWTKHFRPWVRVLLEAHPTREAAAKREKYLKSGWGRRWLMKQLSSHLAELSARGLAT